MLIIIGKKIKIENDAKGLCSAGEKYCLRCQKGTPHDLCHAELWGTFFFLPIIPLGHRYGMRCAVCGRTNEFYVKKRKEAEVEKLIKKGAKKEPKKVKEYYKSSEKGAKRYIPLILILAIVLAIGIFIAAR